MNAACACQGYGVARPERVTAGRARLRGVERGLGGGRERGLVGGGGRVGGRAVARERLGEGLVLRGELILAPRALGGRCGRARLGG